MATREEIACRAPGASVMRVALELLAEARVLIAEDVATCAAIGAAGVSLVPERARILTHCNAGRLATAGDGTALAIVRAAHRAGLGVSVLADETRPFLQGARLTAWELARDGIDAAVITDGMAAHFMQRGEVDLVVVGADRIAANGDVANKIGTYGLAVLARAHRLPFYVAAPGSTVDLATASGSDIPIEERGRDEIACFGEREVVPAAVPVRHPAFDVTPATLVTALVTEHGVLESPDDESLARHLRAGCASPAEE
jgi:methylthioribose-1-phosphate isomerase